MEKDIRYIDNIPMLLNVSSTPNLKLDISFEYVDETLDSVVTVEKNKVYRIIYVNSYHRLEKIIGNIKHIAKIYDFKCDPDALSHIDYLITVDASTSYGSNVKKIRVDDIRAIKLYTPYMDTESVITDGVTTCGLTVTHNITDYTIDGNTISGTLPDTAQTINGITVGTNSDNATVTMINMTVSGGTLVSGTLVSNSTDENGDPVDLIIKNAKVTGGKAAGGELATPITEGTIITYGGVISGDITTKGGITTGDTTSDGTTIGGTIIGGNVITTANGRIAYITGDTVVTGATAFNATIVGGSGSGDGVNNTITGGEGTNEVAVGGTVTGGTLSFIKDFDTDNKEVATDLSAETINKEPEETEDNPFYVADSSSSGIITNFHTADNL